MSAHGLTWAFYSQYRGAERLVALALGDSGGPFPFQFDVPVLARKANLSERCVRRAIVRFLVDGALVRRRDLERDDPGLGAVYEIDTTVAVEPTAPDWVRA